MASETALLEVGVLFTAVALVGLLANRLDQSVIPFYIGIGTLLSPFVAGSARARCDRRNRIHRTGSRARYRFLLLFPGLEFDLDRFSRVTDDTARTTYAFAVGYVLVMSVLGTMLMHYSDRIESALLTHLKDRASAATTGD